ncbi:Ig-like domain-containing protein [Limnofasciculus baicalensis]|uniref:Ig-like domain-containing protein n=1 Tax=Limnofasciculus baicalensis BBK-W-15 TaxID=2699891 RepID=A0AAE3KSC6_9CYAN|nr:Ig-like domain-containing protein [Limnofasciculus baicalensis]MCP2729332.1 Ig-like domain-containing protein [Limnofasciculus baicalensis BBK-W-15]
MKPIKHNNIAFKLKLLGAIAGNFSLILYPGVAHAESSIDVQISSPLQSYSGINSTSESESLSRSGINSTSNSESPLKWTENIAESKLSPLESTSVISQGIDSLTSENSDGQSKQETPTTESQIKILSPTINSVLDVPATSIILQYPEGTEIELKVNGKIVDSSLIGRTETDSKTNLITQTWYGVSLQEGDNTITASIAGSATPIASVQAQVRGAIAKLTLETKEARIPADGRSTATVIGQLLDENGNLSNRDGIITLAATSGEFEGTDYDSDQPGFQVEAKKGEFTAILRSPLQAETATIRATTPELEAFTQLQFETALRPSLMTGVLNFRIGARGTDYFSSFKDFLPADQNNDTKLNVNGAVFATGAIGEWLFTGAYNSERPLNLDCNCDNRLFRSYQASEQNYPIYGDSSKTEVTTPSTDQVYARLERSSHVTNASPDYVMWGDYNTNEFATRSQEFTSITRQLHGFKGNYNLGNLQLSAFYGNNVEGFQRDTVAPDGTSGYYFLSRRLLVPGSEDVFVELEELNRPGTVLQRERLTRGPDYEIDYDRGTLLFREPLLRTDVDRDGNILVRRIVTTYQFESQGENTNIYGGRFRYHLSRELNHESWIGGTYLREDKGGRDFELYGADALISLGGKGNLIAEYAHSSNNSTELGVVSGSAYRVELQGQITPGLNGRAYYRSADTGFANNATVSFVPGQTRYGAQLQARIADRTNLRVQYDREDNNGIAPEVSTNFVDLFDPRLDPIPGTKLDNSLTTISAGIEQRIGKATLGLDWIYRDREDRISGLNGTSSQLRSRFSIPITNNLTFRAQNELTLSSEVDSVYSDRTLLGLDWQVHPGITVGLAQQWFTRGQYAGQSITSLDVKGDYNLTRNTTLTSRFSILGGANGMTGEGAVGLKHIWTISPGLKLDLAYEHVFGDFFGNTAAGKQFPQPYAYGQSASALGFGDGDSYSIGLSYSNDPNFKASARFEHRSSSQGSNTVISGSALGKISPALTALVSYNQANSANQTLNDLGDTINLRVGLAYRDPNDDKFNALLRYEYRKNPATIPNTILLGSGTGSESQLFAAEAIYAPSWRWEFYGKYALRHSTTYLANDLVGKSTVSLAQLRATYRLGYKWDLVGEARWISQPSADYSETAFLIETGYYLTPNLRLAAGYSFGRIEDNDFSGSRSAGGFYAGLTVKLNDLLGAFGGFGRQKATPPQQQESSVEPVAEVKETEESGNQVNPELVPNQESTQQ